MKNYFFFLLITLITTSCSTSMKETEITKLLPEGVYEFEVLDSIEYTPRALELGLAFQEAFKENYDAFMEYSEKKKNGETPIFPTNDYITEAELEEFLENGKNMKVRPSTSEMVKIIHKDGFIGFEAEGKLRMLKYFSYNSRKNVFIFNGEELPFIKFQEIKGNDNAFDEHWEGYTFEFTEPKEASSIMNKELVETLSVKYYSITIGTLNQSNRLLIKHKLVEITEGEEIMNFEIPAVIKK